MDVDEFLRKSYILGGHCPDCGGFWFTEVVKDNPLSIQQRCLKCGKTIDVTEKVNIDTEDIEAIKICTPSKKNPDVIWVPNRDPNIYIKEEPYLDKYKRMLMEV